MADFDAKLTGLSAEILRDALQVYDTSEMEHWLAGYDPMITAWRGDMTGGFPALTGGFAALTGGFPAIGHDRVGMAVSLKKIFRLPGRLPGVRLPLAAELPALARSATLMSHLEALASWLGHHGRQVTAADQLSDADAADAARRIGVGTEYLPYLWEYALSAQWLELEDEPDGSRTWAVLGATAYRWADRDDAGALYVWSVVFASVLARVLEMTAALDPAAARKLNFQGQGVVVAMMLFLARGAELPRTEVSDLIKDGAIGERPGRRARRAWDRWVRAHGDPALWLLRELTTLHAVTVRDSGDNVVGLTPLALWALRRQLRQEAIEIPVLPATVAQMQAVHLVALADAVGEAEFDAATASWVADRGPDQASRELLAFAAFSGPQSRLAAVNLVRKFGIGAHLAWRDAMQRPELRGYARIALSMMAADLPESTLPLVLDPDPEDLAWVATDLLALACGAEIPNPRQVAAQVAEAVPRGEESWVFGLMSHSTHPDVARLLTVLGRHHPDRRLARDARRAARTAARNRAAPRAERIPARSGGR
jgi:hypothetical protein